MVLKVKWRYINSSESTPRFIQWRWVATRSNGTTLYPRKENARSILSPSAKIRLHALQAKTPDDKMAKK